MQTGLRGRGVNGGGDSAPAAAELCLIDDLDAPLSELRKSARSPGQKKEATAPRHTRSSVRSSFTPSSLTQAVSSHVPPPLRVMGLLWAENVKLHAEVSVLRGVTAQMAEEFAPPPQPSDRAPK